MLAAWRAWLIRGALYGVYRSTDRLTLGAVWIARHRHRCRHGHKRVSVIGIAWHEGRRARPPVGLQLHCSRGPTLRPLERLRVWPTCRALHDVGRVVAWRCDSRSCLRSWPRRWPSLASWRVIPPLFRSRFHPVSDRANASLQTRRPVATLLEYSTMTTLFRARLSEHYRPKPHDEFCSAVAYLACFVKCHPKVLAKPNRLGLSGEYKAIGCRWAIVEPSPSCGSCPAKSSLASRPSEIRLVG